LIAGCNAEASVRIPAYNAGGEDAAILEAIAGQETSFGHELLLVDPGSTDEAMAEGRRHSARVVSIPKAELTHRGPSLYAHFVACSLAGQSGIYLGGLAGADPERNPVPGFAERRPSRGV